MIVTLHVATGAAAGALLRSRFSAVFIGPLLHLAGDRLPHEDIPSRRFEVATGALAVLTLAGRCGAFHPATLGAIAASAPDAEHLLPLPRPGGRKLFPSHRVPGWHRAGGMSTSFQLVLAGALLGLVLAAGRGGDR